MACVCFIALAINHGLTEISKYCIREYSKHTNTAYASQVVS
jgi:hypothetical protein